MSKFISFHNALLSCSKFPVRFLARLLESDLRSVHGQNLNNIAVSCSLSWPSDLEKINSKLVKKTVCYRSIPEQESWKINICKELLYLRDNDDAVLPGFTADEQADLLDFLCASQDVLNPLYHLDNCTLQFVSVCVPINNNNISLVILDKLLF